jgi:hypothetical protein
MYVNAKMIPVGTISGISGRGDKEDGVNSRMIYLVHCKNHCKCYNVPTSRTTIENKISMAGYGGCAHL